MKRKKIFSTLLLGALVVASTGMVTSCKDYDDDINNVNSRVDELNTNLTKQISTLQTDLAAAKQTAADAAAAAATAAKTAQSTADKAEADAAAAQVAADAAKLAAANAQAKADQDAIDLASAIQTLTAKIDTKADQSALNDSVAKLSGMIAAIDTRLLVVQDSVKTFSNKIAANYSAISNLQRQVKVLEDFKKLFDVQYPKVLEQLNMKFTDLNNRIDSIKGVLGTIATNIAKNANDIIEINGKLVTDEGDIHTNALAILANTDSIRTNSSDIKVLKGQMKTANTAITDLDTKLNKKILEVNNKIDSIDNANNVKFHDITVTLNVLTVYIDKTITSLVFDPTEWVLSFGAIPVYTFDGLHQITVDSSDKWSVDGETYSVGDQEFSVAPQAVANYHLNPTTADISKYTFKFVDLETTDTYKTRGHQDNLSVSPEVKKTEVNNGILSVYFDFDAANVNDATIDKSTGKAWVSTLALQATQKNLENEDAAVTSDYAVLSPTFAKDLDLGNNEYKDDNTTNRSVLNYLVDKTSKVALNSYRANSDSVSFKLAYNDETGIDLDKKIEVVYMEGTNQKKMSVAEAEKLGFDVNYTLVPYIMNKNSKVDETAASKVALDGGTIAKVAGSDKSAIGHAALVRVEVKKGGKTVVIGYVTILVTPSGLYQVTETYAQGLKIVCGGSQAYTVLSTAVKQDIMEATTVSGDDYDTYYTFDDSKRYTAADNAKVDGTPFGTVALNNAQDTLTWKFTEAELKAKFYDANGNFIAPTADIVTYVKYLSSDTLKYPNVWVKLVIPKDAISHATGKIDLTTAGIKKYWYADRSTIAGSGYDEVHANVQQPGNEGATDDKKFELNLLTTFNGNKVNATLDDPTGYSTFDTEASIYFDVAKYEAEKDKEWSSASGAKYKLTATETAVYAEKVAAPDEPAEQQVVVRLIDGKTVQLQDNEFAKDLLNVAPHKNADGTTDAFLTYMILKADHNCFPIDLGSSKSTFNVRYLRPIDVVSSNAAPFEDAAKQGYSELYIADLFNFNDWRDFTFGKENQSWLSFYGISALVPDIANAQCDLNGTWQKLSDVTSLIKLTPNTTDQAIAGTWAQFRTNMGTIRYENNGATVGEFNLRIPFTVVHYWGKIENVEINILVKKSVNNAKKN
jgi:multidrug efflux pump subunit AcrA (membrane-fusion protein)